MTFKDVSIDDVTAYWDRRPCNIRHSNSRVGTLGYFQEVRHRKYKVEPHILDFADFGRWGGKRVLEVGCGIGTDTIEFAKAGAEVVAVDVSRESLALARLRAYEYGLDDRIKFVHGNAEHLSGNSEIPFYNYDLVYSFGVLHHTPNPRAAIQELAYFCGPATYVKFMLYNRLSIKALSLTHGALWDSAAIARQSEAQTGCPVTYAYYPWEIAGLLRPNFGVEHLSIDHIFPYKLEPYLRYEYERTPLATVPGFGALEKVLGWHLLIDAYKEPQQ